MASGNTLLVFMPYDNEPPSANYATLDTRNGHPCLDFDDTTQEAAIFTGVLPRNYSGGGLTVYIHYAATSAVANTAGWDVAFERIGDSQLDIDADSFATAQQLVPATVPGTSGHVDIMNVAIAGSGSPDVLDGIAVGESFRLRVRRDAVVDSAAGDLELIAVELKET